MRKNFSIIFIFITFLSNNQTIWSQPKHLVEIGVHDSLYSNTLNEIRDIWVQLPDNFDPESEIKYPALYVLDGGVHLNAVSTVHSYYSQGFFPEMIIVGISNRENRTRDLTTSEIEMRRGVAYQQETGGAENFINFIKNELIPYIDGKYPTTNYRTLVGHSYAGLFTINVLLNHTELFNNYLAIDPSLDWDEQKLLKQSEEILRSKDFKGRSLFMSLGGQLHMQKSEININNVMQDTSEYSLISRSNIEFYNLTKENKQNGLNVYWKFYEFDLHGTVPLPSIRDGLINIFNWYPIEGTYQFNDPKTPKEVLVNLIKEREKILAEQFGYSVPPFPEDLLNMLGYMNLEWGNLEKSLAFFQLNIEYFPKSANAYDSISDYYASQNDYKNALKYVTKAYDISKNDYHKQRIEKFKNKE